MDLRMRDQSEVSNPEEIYEDDVGADPEQYSGPQNSDNVLRYR